MVKRFLASVAIGFLMLGMVGAASGTTIIDQSQNVNDIYLGAFNQSDLAQSFKQTSNNIVGAGIFLRENILGSTDTITIQLRDALGGNILASGSSVGTKGTWVDVFWSEVSISANTTYYLIFSSLNETLGIAGSLDDPYSNGQAYAGTGFVSWPAYDYTFRTYSDDRSNTVPEPATMALFGLGLLGLAGVSRKQK